jgi:tetratricopeptide (TPR) repeat protein
MTFVMRYALYVVAFMAMGSLPAIGHTQPSTEALAHWHALIAEVEERYNQGRYAEAVPLAQQALTLAEATFGPEHPRVATSLQHLARLHRELGRYAEAEPLLQRALTIREQILGPEHPEVASSLNELALLSKDQGRYAQAEPLLQRALTIREQALGVQHPEVAESLNDLAVLYQAQGRYAEAEPFYQRALRIREQALGPKHPDVALSLNNLATLYQAQGQLAQAEPLFQRALTIGEQALGPQHPQVATSLNNLALLYREQGRYTEAEPLLQQALAIWEQALGPQHPQVAIGLNNLGLLYFAQGRYGKAEPLLQRALTIREQALGPGHPSVATNLNNLAALYQHQGSLREAEPFYQRALTIWEQALGPEHPHVAMGLNNLAELYRQQGRYVTAEPLYQRAIEIVEQVLGPTHPHVASSLNNLALLYQRQGRYAAAEPLLQRALAIWEHALGEQHPQVVGSLNNLAQLYAAQERLVEARPLYTRARRLALTVARLNAPLEDPARQSLVPHGRQALDAYVQLLVTLARSDDAHALGEPPAWEAFVVAEQRRTSAAQAALQQASARAAATDPTLAPLVQGVEVRREQLSGVRTQLAAPSTDLPTAARRTAAQQAALQARERELSAELLSAVSQWYTACPRCAELAVPEPITAAEVQALLHPGEALVSYAVLDDRLLVWLVRPDQTPVYHDLPLDKATLTRQIAQVRASLEQDPVHNPGLALGELIPVDVAMAYQLYQTLLAPLRDALVGVTHLLVVPDDILLPLPFGVLITDARGEGYAQLATLYRQRQRRAPTPAELATYAEVAWLAKDYALTMLPSATALRLLRQGPRRSATAQEPFIGFGDPVLSGPPHVRPNGAAQPAQPSPAAILEAVRQLQPLPQARSELLAMAHALGADPIRALYLGSQATESMVYTLNALGRLGAARVLAFSTHGMRAGELAGLHQPALVLTPPATVSPDDDGLLSLDEVVRLKLAATEWVVLSACNTAAADGSGEGLSGLVRGFFFAGAPALLVSHWSVGERATAALMTALFAASSEGPGRLRAARLQQAMRTLMTQARGETAYFAHPYAWAAFFLVGEGGMP